ncbi:MAG: ribosomal biogenesis protein [Euryarchaeota archaeon]|nr:ribosomal biogenesis protein [Euryarchaeota archaeon]
MLITTSRNPSDKTRSFSRSLSNILPSRYINRGKMSIRDVFLKAHKLGLENIILVSQIKGNPSRITFYNDKGESVLSLDITVALEKSGRRIEKDDLTIRCEVDDLGEKLSSILKIPEDKGGPNSNIIWIKKGKKGYEAIIEFYDRDGHHKSPKIYVKNWKFHKNEISLK